MEIRGWATLAGSAVLFFGLSLTLATPAQAAPKRVEGAIGARFRFHAATDAFGFQYAVPRGQDFDDIDDADPEALLGAGATAQGPAINRLGVGLGRLSLADEGSMQILRPMPGWSVGFGAMFAEYRAVAGARVHVAYDSLDDGDGPRLGLVSGQFVPYVRWLGRAGERVRPYGELRVGLGGGAIRQRNDAGTGVLRTLYPTVGVEAGAAIFVVDYFSVDVGLGADYFAPFGRAKAESGGMTLRSDWLRSADVLNAALTVGFSVWFS